MYSLNSPNILILTIMAGRSSKASSLAAKAASVSNNSLRDRKVLKRMSFSSFEEEYLPEEWDTVIGTSKVDGSTTLSINFEEDGEEKVCFYSNEVKSLVAEGKLDYQQTVVCWYEPTDSEVEFIQLQRKAEGIKKGDVKALQMALAKKKQKKA